ncbi:MAG: hypothetical protein HY221_00410 [Candidatus Sungbacteria bacterium]|uniref:Uncharacterized protein n=1 Tax=Candidatus Sungiibacteriota bacterium TaxID=2750080 RepID=A0A932QYE8_9BACT|nr:hypothetical protein [Candidatus Sungbacteria bacterium]
MKKLASIGSIVLLTSAIGLLGMAFPALADTHEAGDVQINVHSTILHNGDLNEHEASSSDSDKEDIELHATTTPWMNGEKRGLLKHFGTTTPPGIMKHHATTDEDASTTDKEGKGPKNGLHIGLPFFLQWLFGLPATTTIGQLRADIQASTTASTTSPSQGPGFWAHLFGFFHFGGK